MLSMPTANFASCNMGINCLWLSCQGSTSHRSFHVPLTLLAGGKAASICRFLFCLQVPQREVPNYQTLVCALTTNHSVICPIWEPGPKPCPLGIWRCEDVGVCSRRIPPRILTPWFISLLLCDPTTFPPWSFYFHLNYPNRAPLKLPLPLWLVTTTHHFVFIP